MGRNEWGDFRRSFGGTLFGVHCLSYAAFRTGEEDLSQARSRFDLPADRRHVHAVSLGELARALGVELVWRCLGVVYNGDCLEVFSGGSFSRALNNDLYPDGLVDRNRFQTAVCNRSGWRNLAVGFGWALLHGRHGVLPLEIASVSPRDLAFVCARGEHLPLLFDLLLRVAGFGGVMRVEA